MTNLIEFYTIITERLKAAAYNLLMLPEEQRLIPKLELMIEKELEEMAKVSPSDVRIVSTPERYIDSGRQLVEERARLQGLF